MNLQGIVNGVGNIANTLFDLSPKSFYSIGDFYNFIKKRQNAPMARKHFAIVPRTQIFTADGNIPIIWQQLFTDTNLAKFAITAQSISYGSFGYNNPAKITNQVGNYSYIEKGQHISAGGTFSMSFLETANPIIESFIVPWFYEVNRTNYIQKEHTSIEQYKTGLVNNVLNSAGNALNNAGLSFIGNSIKQGKRNTAIKNYSQYPCPKLMLDIKFYRMDEIAGLQFLMNPTFVYRLTGVYPSKVNPAAAKHGSDYTLTRQVTFNYNNFICIPGPKYQTQLTGNHGIAFAYRNMSPIQLLNALNQAVTGVSSIANNVKGMF